jgi:hypothetical protein
MLLCVGMAYLAASGAGGCILQHMTLHITLLLLLL